MSSSILQHHSESDGSCTSTLNDSTSLDLTTPTESVDKHGSAASVEEAHARLNAHKHAKTRYSSYAYAPQSPRYLDAYGSTRMIEDLSRNFPTALCAQAEPVSPMLIADLSEDALIQMIDSKRASSAARRIELKTMELQVVEKTRQIELLNALMEMHQRCIRLEDADVHELEDYAQHREIAVEAALGRKREAARQQKKLLFRAELHDLSFDASEPFEDDEGQSFSSVDSSSDGSSDAAAAN
ncbi:hypothetical protein DAEQUDRAFT_770339 [Daedalea quercina L-15889]|uniref:Uncharacterized protein n=1 Tax=Daedalea quercina L-15889 TaxID=1314783 RepID=A0A165KY10_9APHY|nr:hypothetical protein DAEQUDRAFT_770339 [Daedalea quercina L-15889]